MNIDWRNDCGVALIGERYHMPNTPDVQKVEHASATGSESGESSMSKGNK